MERRITILEKDGMLGAIGKVEGGGQAIVSTYDSRVGIKTFNHISEPGEARREFNKAIKQSGENGWTVIYDGEPMYG